MVFRRAIERMAPYVPGEQPGPRERVIKLNTNENPYSPAPAVGRAIRLAARDGNLRLYPHPAAGDFIAAASKFYRVSRKMILAGNGSDELLAMLFRATIGRSERVAYPVPTYSLYDTLASIQEARIERQPFSRDFELPAEALSRARARLTIVCNPNSPSGTFTPVDALARLARKLTPRLLAIDEAYVDFADDNALRLAVQSSNVVVLRTLSKSFSLAGARLGLCFAHPRIIENLYKVKDSYNLSRLAVAAGAAALADPGWMERNVARIRRTRDATERALRAMGFEVPRSSANFVLARMPGRNLNTLAIGLRRKGILVRYFDSPALRDALRISIGSPAEMRALFGALKEILAGIGRSGITREQARKPAIAGSNDHPSRDGGFERVGARTLDQ